MPTIGDVDVGAERTTKVKDQAGYHYTCDDFSEPNTVLSCADLCFRRRRIPCADSLEIFRCTLHL